MAQLAQPLESGAQRLPVSTTQASFPSEVLWASVIGAQCDTDECLDERLKLCSLGFEEKYADSAMKGGRPVSISYKIIPNEYSSDRGVGC